MAGSWVAELLPRNAYQAAYTPEAPIIGFAFESQVGVHAFGTDRRAAFRAKPNGLAYVPAGLRCLLQFGKRRRIPEDYIGVRTQPFV